MRLFVACALILSGILVNAQNYEQASKNETKPKPTADNPQPPAAIIEVQQRRPAIEPTTQPKQQAPEAESRPFLTHGEWVMAILTTIYVGISYFGLRAIKKQADIAQLNAQALIDAERAWIDIDLSRTGTFYSFTVTNFGRTLAIVTGYTLITGRWCKKNTTVCLGNWKTENTGERDEKSICTICCCQTSL
jgi:hypothetical protein